MSRFDFLKHINQHLFELSSSAEMYLDSDPNTSLVRLRQFGEVLANLTAKKLNLAQVEQETQHSLLTRLRNDGNIKRSVISMFHEVRISGNKAVHEGLKDIEEARRILNIAYKLSDWFEDSFYGNVKPKTSSSQLSLVKEKLEKPACQSNMNIDRNLLTEIIYIDLEVDKDDNIYRLGLKEAEAEETEIDTQDISIIMSKLSSKKDFLVCGHNFRRFDYSYLQKYCAGSEGLLIIDTLELSVIAFPLEHSHKLNKEYKLSDFASNDPSKDALATSFLLEEIIDTFNSKPKNVFSFLSYLLTCGKDQASQAYQKFFGIQNPIKPDINLLPIDLTSEIDMGFLERYMATVIEKDFDERLCLAGIISWIYESKTNNSKSPLSGWLGRFPQFQSVLNHIRPLKPPLEFTYQPYLQEFGIEKFRGNQEEAIQSILSHLNPLILMATGAGKSLCFQLPALMLSRRQKGLTVVISPLQSLMADQVQGLEEKGLDFATFINGNLRPAERNKRLEQLYNGEKDLLYISAEQLRSPSIRYLLQRRLPSLIVFDEAHCISQWGHDFRPDYRYAPKFISELYQNQQRELPLMAFMTATATVNVREDIKSLFAAHQIFIHTEICSSTKRENLEYRIIPTCKQDKNQILIAEVQQALTLGGAVLVYTATRKNAEQLAQLLNQNGVESEFYHGKISKQDKDEILRKFKNKELNVIVATCAFGMGIDRSDVRAVIHHTMSSNLEGYVQEAGRAGRDGKPAICSLLFDPQDADTAFFLQSLNQLSEPELRNLFIAVRELRDQIYGTEKISEEYFWVTTNEIFQNSDLDNDFASDNEQKDTKIKVALSYLETFGMIEREENQSSFIKFELAYPTPQESLKEFDVYAHKNNLPNYRRDEFHRLILAMHIAKSYCQEQGEPYPLEKLSDDSGVSIKELKQSIKELQKAEICKSKIPITILITKIDRGNKKNDARTKYEKHRDLEKKICDELVNLMGNRQEIQINCRALATRLDPDREQKLTSRMILEILEGWNFLKWIDYQKIRYDVIKITEFAVIENFDNYQNLISRIIDLLYRALEGKTGKHLCLSQDLVTILSQINQITSPQVWELEELEKSLAWMHQHHIIRLADSPNLFHQAMKIRVIKGANKDKVTREYPKKVKPHYDEQVRRTHIMLDYGKQYEKSSAELQKYIEDYFSLAQSQFSAQHPQTDSEEARRPVTQEDYDRIMGQLNPVQREIVLCEAPAISVIAGPGSGKTRTIVHRIAYLIKVKRVNPSKIIALAYNRNAVRELRIRLQNLIGELASRVRVYTFHGLSLSILGRTVEQTSLNDKEPKSESHKSQDAENKFEMLIKDACQYLRQSDEDKDNQSDEDKDNNDLEVRISKLLGNCEYIFVDEYQDVAEYEYELVKLIAGLQVAEDNSKSVATNICVIGDDDQNIYEFRHTSTKYIRSFQAEYQAKQFLLTENYRSTEPIIAAANRLIQNNTDRLKRRANEQVRINNDRVGQGGLEVQALKFQDDNYQAEFIKRQVKKWVDSGIKPGEIAVIAKQWESLDKARALLEREANIPTNSLQGKEVKLVRNLVTQLLLRALEKNSDLILPSNESVISRFESYFIKTKRDLQEPTVKKLLRIAEQLDRERGYGDENLAQQITVSEIITSIYEYNDNPENSVDDDAIVITSCHSAKGLEFKHVILIADGFSSEPHKIEQERRLFYVAMTRAKEKLLLVHTQSSNFITETGANIYPTQDIRISPPQFIYYRDMTPEDVHLGFEATKNNQDIIKELREGDLIELKATSAGNNWTVRNNNRVIGLLSNKAVSDLRKRNINPGIFIFQSGEVSVRSIYRHVEIDEITGEILNDWYVVIPRIRVCR